LKKSILLMTGFLTLVLIVSVANGANQQFSQFSPKITNVPGLTFTGIKFNATITQTPELIYLGNKFTPKITNTPDLTFTGFKFTPTITQTPELLYIGNQFAPNMINVSALTFIGDRFLPKITQTPPLRFVGQRSNQVKIGTTDKKATIGRKAIINKRPTRIRD
jgi:hypothetical protein